MKDLMKFEFRKLKTQKSFYIILIIMVAMVLITTATYKLVENLSNEIEEMGNAVGQTIRFSGEGFWLGFASASNFGLLTAIFVAINVTYDYDNQIVKNIFARGYSRTDFFFAKFVYLIVTTSIMFFAAVAVSGVTNAIFFGINGDIGKIVLLLDVQYLVCMASVVMCFAISAIIKRLGGSIAACIIIPIAVSLVLGLVDVIINVEAFDISDYWLSSFTDKLADIEIATKDIIIRAVLSVAYGVGFAALGWFFTDKAEL